jgi:glycosyltransferase involved in cell wall biosynthesis
MRILQVNKFNYRRGGAEAYMEDLAQLQERAGHTVEFFAMQHPDNRPSTYSRYFPSQVDFEPPPPTVSGKVMGVGRMVWSTSAARGMASVVDDFQPDVVHLHNIYHQLSPSILRPLAARGIPAVITLHDYKLACPTHNFLCNGVVCEACLGGHFTQAVRRRCQGGSVTASAAAAFELGLHTLTRAYKPVGVFICPSQFMLTKMTEAGVFPDRLRRLSHFMDASQIPVRTEPGRGVFYAGRLSHEKGVDVLVRAAAHLRDDVEVHLAGDGPELDSLRALAEHCAPGRIHFHGRVPRERVHEFMRDAAVVVLPSRCYENQPIAVLEAFAAGTPVVGARLGGVPELVQPGRTGDLAPADDPEGFARAIQTLIDDPDTATALGKQAREFVEREFSPAVHLARLEDLYAQAATAVGGQGGGAVGGQGGGAVGGQGGRAVGKRRGSVT